MKRIQTCLIAGALCMLSSAHSSMADMVSNLDEPNQNAAAVGPLGGSPEGGALAQMFSTPADGPGWTLDSLTLALGTTGTPPGSLTVQLYSDASGTPGSLLGNLNGPDPVPGGVYGQYAYTPASTLLLAPNTSYFALLTAETSPADFYTWRLTSSTAEVGDPGWTIADVSRYNPSGTTWEDRPVQKMMVAATAVPEPSSMLLTIAGISALLLGRRCRTR